MDQACCDVDRVVAARLHAVRRAGHPATAAVGLVRGRARLAPDRLVAVGEAVVASQSARPTFARRRPMLPAGALRRRGASASPPSATRRRVGELVQPDDPPAAGRRRHRPEHHPTREAPKRSKHQRILPWPHLAAHLPRPRALRPRTDVTPSAPQSPWLRGNRRGNLLWRPVDTPARSRPGSHTSAAVSPPLAPGTGDAERWAC